MASIIPASQFRSNNVRIITYDTIDDVALETTQLNFIKNIFRQYAGQTIQISKRYFNPTTNQFVDDTQIQDIPVNGFNSWWRIFSQFFFPDSDEWIFGESYNPAGTNASERAQVLIMTADRVGTSNYEQFFLDGTTHCVFTPMMNWAIDRCIESKSKSAQSRYNSKAKKIEKYIQQYSKGVPTKDFQKICNELQIAIEIDVPTSVIDKDTEYIKVRSQKKPIKTFRFINTRLNHIELNEVSTKDNYEKVSQAQLKEIWDNTDFKLWRGNRETELFQVNTKDMIYKLSDEEGYHHQVEEFMDINKEDGNDLDQCRIEHYSNKKLSKFILNNVNRNQGLFMDCPFLEYTEEYNYFKDFLKDSTEMDYYEDIAKRTLSEGKITDEGCLEDQRQILKVCEYVRSLDNLNHIDLQKAYTRGSECSFYQGYLGKITDFRRCNKIVGLGIYQINNIQNIPPLLQKLGVLYDNNSYPSPELEFYRSLGITFDIVCGCWGSRIDIDFGNEWDAGMFLKDDKGTPHYAKWYGCLMRLVKQERFNFDCKDLEYAKLNNISDKCDIRFNEYTNTGIIEYKKDKVRHSAHIASFIHTYSRISVIEQLLKFKDISQIVAVEVDGIFYRGDVEIGDLFVLKPGKTTKHIQFNQYVSNLETPPIVDLPEYRAHNPVEVHTGPGGAGKTHNNLVDKGLLYPLYVAPSWKLSRNKSQEYDIPSSVYYYLICDDPDVYRPIQRNYNTLIIDEISMLSNENKKLILERFKNHKLIFCGDLGYQLPPVEGYEFNEGNLPVFQHTNNYRCKCKKLLKILTKMRQLIAKDLIDIDTKEILTKFGFTIEKKEDIQYSVEDLIITRTHKTKDIYTEKYKDLKKYQVKENTLDYSNGEIIIGDKPHGVNSVLQHAFTIHSIQGETCKTNLFIDINKMSCLRMLYTALSRAKFFSQIKIIE